MNNLNSIIIEGNVVRDSKLLEPAEGFKKYVIPVAVNRWYKNHNGDGVEEVSFFDVVTYGKMAEHTEKKASKGRGIRVVGRLKQDRWKDESGKSYGRVYIIAEHIEYKPALNAKGNTNAELPEVSAEEIPDFDNKETASNNLVF